jgi:hypothetical protein
VPPHPDYTGCDIPREAEVGRFRLSVLAPEHVEEDFAVIVDSAPVLAGIFDSGWPDGLTLERNLDDLVRHAREFDEGEAFAWIVRADDGTYLGCAYLRPKGEGAGTVYTWLRRRPDRLDLLAEFNAAFRPWIAGLLPSGYSLSWRTNDGPDPAKRP